MRKHQSYLQCTHKSTKNENRNNKETWRSKCGHCIGEHIAPLTTTGQSDGIANHSRQRSSCRISDKSERPPKMKIRSKRIHRFAHHVCRAACVSYGWRLGSAQSHRPCVGDRTVTMPCDSVIPLFPNKPCIARIVNILVLASLRTGLVTQLVLASPDWKYIFHFTEFNDYVFSLRWPWLHWILFSVRSAVSLSTVNCRNYVVSAYAGRRHRCTHSGRSSAATTPIISVFFLYILFCLLLRFAAIKI